MKKVPYRFYLSEDQIPAQWYNLRARYARTARPDA